MHFGERVSVVTIKGLIAHIVVGEAFWSGFLTDCDDGASMVPPANFELANEFGRSGDFQALAHKTQAQSMEAFRSLPAVQLGKHVVWSKRRWTVMGFLWGM